MPGLDIIAHRGASDDAPENTLAAFRLGYSQGAEACELDVHLSQDGRVVVMHDPTTERTTGTKLTIAQSPAADILKLDAGQWGKFSKSGFREKVPLLSDALALIPDGRRMFIELKSDGKTLPELTRTINQSGKRAEQLPIITFSFTTATAAKRMLPSHEVSWLVGYDRDAAGRFPELDALLARAVANGLSGLSLNHQFPVDAAFTRKVHDAGLKLYVWTVDDPAVARRYRDLGIDGITTNRPEWLRAQLGLK